MPTTNYYTLNGEIRGESTGGVRTDYLRDALGSVTATVDSSAVVLNTYRYKPYGARLAKTGASADPSFLFTGTSGSRPTAVAYAEQYNQARHYGSSQGDWTTVDDLWPEESAYGYVSGNPTTWSDPTGLQVFIIGEAGIVAEPKILDLAKPPPCFRSAYPPPAPPVRYPVPLMGPKGRLNRVKKNKGFHTRTKSSPGEEADCDALKKSKSKNCRGLFRGGGCEGVTDCDELSRRRSAFEECASARRKFTELCLKGASDAGHDYIADLSQDFADKCADTYRDLCVGDYVG